MNEEENMMKIIGSVTKATRDKVTGCSDDGLTVNAINFRPLE